MLTGKRFRLTKTTFCIESVNGSRHGVEVPAGDMVKVLSGPRPDDKRMIDVLWNKRVLAMFAEDIQTRGEEVKEEATGR